MLITSETILAAAEGFGLALSPCILPILPLILASTVTENKTRPLQIVLGFILSFSAFSLLSRAILMATGIMPSTIQFAAFLLLFLFGLVMLLPNLEERFAAFTSGIAGRAQQASNSKWTKGPLGGFLIGSLIGLIWTPCAGPILAVALVQIIQAQTTSDALFIILAFSIGASVPMLGLAYSGQYLTKYVRALSKHTVAIRRVMGVVILAIATLGLVGVNLNAVIAASTSNVVQVVSYSNALQNSLDKPVAAPEITGIQTWLNSQPLTIESLKGKVILIDFWTYSCINCIRTLPHLKDWHAKYADKGLVIIGVHSPEFSFEAETDNVKKAIEKFGVTYPVALDNKFATWQAYKNRYWPAHYLIDTSGQVVYTHFGEGNYDVTEHNIRYLLGLDTTQPTLKEASASSSSQTPETYLGTARADREVTGTPKLDEWQLGGEWIRHKEYIEAKADARLTLNFKAKKVFLVATSNNAQPLTVETSAEPKSLNTPDADNGKINISKSRLYTLLTQEKAKQATITLNAPAGMRFYAFTFES